MEARDQLKALSLDLLPDLGACPAVAFHESLVLSRIEARLRDMGLPSSRDRYGNLLVRLSGDGKGQPPVAFVAHTDHPGFEVVEVLGDGVTARALGGVPQACFSQEVPVQLVLPGGGRLPGRTAGPTGPEDHRMVSLRLEGVGAMDLPRPVVFDLPEFELDGQLIRMRALDDLAGCAAILGALRLLAARRDGLGEVYGVFTRAEEVGLVGARLLAADGVLPKETLVVSLEASRTLPGAALAEGPVIRVGDASLTFDAEAEAMLLKAAEELKERDPAFRAQRQLMSGGTCEASAFRYYGYRTTGVAFPLGNYHNATPEGGVGAEFIHLEDFLGGVELIVQAARCVSRRRESRPWRRMAELPEGYRRRLAQTAGH
jgi:endoglucanase